MGIKRVVAPTTTEQILLVVLTWVGLNVELAHWLNAPLLRAEILITSLVVFGWVVWAIHYRLERAEMERYQQNREEYG